MKTYWVEIEYKGNCEDNGEYYYTELDTVCATRERAEKCKECLESSIRKSSDYDRMDAQAVGVIITEHEVLDLG